eukprot:TRINITY_DN8615_c0_g1_i3.p1 TRINITY_DN8615_c0_g1~~TRINITY_DN8615_c0_g1_i3.p1  ORF type:complete len:831 (+),score=239.67 TRINITY_DN8615_c0_g1_i3:76-2568(+)
MVVGEPLRVSVEAGTAAAEKILVAARLAGLEVELTPGSKKTPCGLPAPELVQPDGNVVRHTNAILRQIAHITDCGLLGATFAQEGAVDSWMEWTALEVEHLILEGADTSVICSTTEAHLAGKTFLVGQRLTLADVCLACALRQPLEKAGLDSFRKTFPNTIRWLQTCLAHMGPPAAPKAAAPKKEAPAAKGAAKAKAKATAAPAAAPAGGASDDEIKAVGDEIRVLKEKLKAEGMSGKKINDHEQVKALVEKLQALKAGAPAAAPAAAPPAKAPEAAPAAEGKNADKNAAKKAAKEEEKRKKEEEKKRREEELQAQRDAKFNGPSLTLDNFEEHKFGSLFIQSEKKTGREWTPVSALLPGIKDKLVWVRARVHNSRKQGNKLVFLTLRQDVATVQAVVFGQEMAGFAGALPDESVIDVYGKVVVPDQPVASCTQSGVELNVERVYCIGRSTALPLQLADASRSEVEYEKDSSLVRVNQDVRLDNRVIDLRTVANQAIFRIQSGVCTLFREFLLQNSFQEIHTPKLIGGASEGGADVFRVDYFEGDAFLAQSPQLYKQMALMTDMPRVFEIGPIFRSEKSFTHRHMTEFTGLDIEMTFKDHYHEVLDVLDGLFNHIFEGLNKRFSREIEAVRSQYPFEDLKWKYPCRRFTFKEAVALLKSKGPPLLEQRIKAAASDYEKGLIKKHLEAIKVHDDFDDISTEDEKVLGAIVLKEFGEELYIIDKFPKEVRPFYTMPDPVDGRWANAYDVFLRGEEITSGAQRIHCPKMLAKMAEEKGVPASSIQSYIDAFKYGSYPHGGAGIGMERVVMLFMSLNNIRKTSMFPRDPKRLSP